MIEVKGPVVIVSRLIDLDPEAPEGSKTLHAVWRREYLVSLRALNAHGEEVSASITSSRGEFPSLRALVSRLAPTVTMWTRAPRHYPPPSSRRPVWTIGAFRAVRM